MSRRRLELGEELDVYVYAIAGGTGDGVGRIESGQVVFTDVGLPGDRVRGVVTTAKKNFAKVDVLRVDEPSRHAEEPECPVADRCGGCRFWRAPYEAELGWKAQAAVGSVERVACEVEWPEPFVVEAPSDRHMRERARFALTAEGLGFREKGSHDAVVAETCLALHPALEEVRTSLGTVLSPHDMAVDHVMLELDAPTEDVAVLVRARRGTAAIGDVLRTWLEERDDVHTLVLASDEGETLLCGDGTVRRTLETRPDHEGESGAEVRYQRPPVAQRIGGFSQSSSISNEELRAILLQAAGKLAGKKVLELFSGSGNLTSVLLEAGAWVVAAEGAGDAVEAARAAFAADVAEGRLELIEADLSRKLPGGLARDFDLVIVDPPRTGMRERLTRAVGRLEADAIIYIACDPVAMARDATTLAEAGYAVESWVLLDLFPRTPHMEAVVRFERTR